MTQSGNRTRELPAGSSVPQPTAPPAACPASFALTRRHPHINQVIHFSTLSIFYSKRSTRGPINQQKKSHLRNVYVFSLFCYSSHDSLYTSLSAPLPHSSPSSSIQQCTICFPYTEGKRAQTTRELFLIDYLPVSFTLSTLKRHRKGEEIEE